MFASTNSGLAYAQASNPRGLIWPRSTQPLRRPGKMRRSRVLLPVNAKVGAGMTAAIHAHRRYTYPVLTAMTSQ